MAASALTVLKRALVGAAGVVVSPGSPTGDKVEVSGSGISAVYGLSVKSPPYNAAGDGVTSDQTAIAAAVAAAFAANAELYWPAGVYVSTANIPNFWDVRHRGPGVVKRGSASLYITPTDSQTNALHLSPTGSDSNDGLSASEPRLTLQTACDVVNDDGRLLRGRWVLDLAAGTYTQKLSFSSLAKMGYPLTIKGATGWVTAPTTILVAPLTTDTVVAFSVEGWFSLQDVKISGATAGTAVSNNRSYVDLVRVHSENCKNAVLAQHSAFTSIGAGCEFNGSGLGGIGFNEYYNSTHSITGASVIDSPLFKNFADGLIVQEGCQGHLDYTRVHDCTRGVTFQRGAGACNTKLMQVYRCGTGLTCVGNIWFNNGMDFGAGADACTVNVKAYGGSAEVDYLAYDNAGKAPWVVDIDVPPALTGSAAETTIDQEEIRSWMISEGGHYSEFFAYGTCALASTCSLRLYVNDGATDDYITGIVIPAGKTQWRARFRVDYTAENVQRGYIEILFNDGTSVFGYGVGVLPMKNKTGNVRWTAQLASAADTFTAAVSQYSTTLGG